MCIEGHVLVKNDSKIPQSVTGGQDYAMQSKHLVRQLEVIQVFIPLRHSCSLINWCLLSGFMIERAGYHLYSNEC